MNNQNQQDQTSTFSALLQAAITEPGKVHSAYRAFHGYSVGNQLLALIQCAERGIAPGPIASFNKWKERGRYVQKGQKALALWMDAHLSNVIERLNKGKVVKVGTANPKALADMLIGIAERGRRDIHFYQGDPYVYTETHYVEMDGGDYAGKVTRIIERKYQRQTLALRERLRQFETGLEDVDLEKQVVARPVTEGVVRDVVASIRANTLVPADAELPMFIQPRGLQWRSINVANGIIHLDKLMTEGSTPVWMHSPGFFSLTCLQGYTSGNESAVRQTRPEGRGNTWRDQARDRLHRIGVQCRAEAL